MIRDHAFFVKPTGAPSGVSLQSRVTELESELAGLKEQLGKAKGINDVMWETVVQRLVAEGKDKGGQKGQETGTPMDEDGAEGKRRRKRNRT